VFFFFLLINGIVVSYEKLKENVLIRFERKLIMSSLVVRLTAEPASREWRSGATPTND
jgi:hypothetical protein